jgi:aspartate aminotransferase-like enzyme
MKIQKIQLMTLGPVQIEQSILDIGACPIPYPRTQEYSDWFADINVGLQYIFGTERPVFMVTCSGTGVMQMAAANVCAEGTTALTFSTGTFGKRWGEITRSVGAKTIETFLPEGENVTPDLLKSLIEQHAEAKTIFLTYNETSTTALADVKGCAELICNTDRILVVDAVSALLAEPLPMDAWGVDVVISSSQKALALPPGLGFIAFSPKAWKQVLDVNCRSYYFDARNYEKEWGRNQVPFTPSLSIVLQLKQRLIDIRREGMENFQQYYRKHTTYLRNGLKSLGFTFLSERMGNCTTAVCVPIGIKARRITDIMREKERIVFVPPYPGSNTFRIGNFGAIGTIEIDRCLHALASVLRDLLDEKSECNAPTRNL